MKETFIDKLLQKDSVTPVRRLVIGGLIATSALIGGTLPMVAMSLASMAINTVVFRHEKKIQQKKLVNFYKDEIATLLHKDPESLTIEDLKQVAAPVEQGGRGIVALGHELKEMDTLQKFRMAYSSTSSVATTGILIGMCAIPGFLSGGLTMILGLGLITMGYTVIAKTVKATGQAIFGNHETDNSVNQRLMRIAEEIKEKPVNPVEIFGLFVDANPKLEAMIEARFHMPYADLPVLQKKQVVEAFEPDVRVIALTEAVNNGEIKPSLVGFIVSGSECKSLPGFTHYQKLFEQPVATLTPQSFELARNVNLSEHRLRLQNERENVASRSLH